MKYLLLGAALAASMLPLHGQGGPLTPPGAPGPTYKTLDEIEPRVPLIAGAPGVTVAGSGTISIGASGSYYLTRNLTVTTGAGIIVGASGVTVDLRGFTISSAAATATAFGINILGSNVAIANGHIVSGTTFSGGGGDQFTGGGFIHGIHAGTDSLRNLRVRDISVKGCDMNGIHFADLTSTIAEFCTVRTAGGFGIRAGTVQDCAASECGGTAIDGITVTNCRGESVGNEGISGTVVSHCHGVTTSTSVSAVGVLASYAAENCFGHSLGGEGIQAANVSNCQGVSSATATGADGIEAFNAVSNSTGSSFGGDGINCSGTVAHSYGISSSNSSSARGIDAQYNVHHSYGQSSNSDGILAANVSDSYGITISSSTASDGIDATYTVSDSFGQTTLGGNGIRAANVAGSYGTTLSSNADADGIEATHGVRGSYGKGAAGTGIQATNGNVDSSTGESTGNDGIRARNVINSSGISTSTPDTSHGIEAIRNVQNSYGEALGGHGISSFGCVSNSYGITQGTTALTVLPTGIFAYGSVHNSYGFSAQYGGINAKIASFSFSEYAGFGSGTAFISVGCVGVSGGWEYLQP